MLRILPRSGRGAPRRSGGPRPGALRPRGCAMTRASSRTPSADAVRGGSGYGPCPLFCADPRVDLGRIVPSTNQANATAGADMGRRGRRRPGAVRERGVSVVGAWGDRGATAATLAQPLHGRPFARGSTPVRRWHAHDLRPRLPAPPFVDGTPMAVDTANRPDPPGAGPPRAGPTGRDSSRPVPASQAVAPGATAANPARRYNPGRCHTPSS